MDDGVPSRPQHCSRAAAAAPSEGEVDGDAERVSRCHPGRRRDALWWARSEGEVDGDAVRLRVQQYRRVVAVRLHRQQRRVQLGHAAEHKNLGLGT